MGQGRAGDGNSQGILSVTTPFSCYQGISRINVCWLNLWIIWLPKLEQYPKEVKRLEGSLPIDNHNPKQLSNSQLPHWRVGLISSLSCKLPGKVCCLLRDSYNYLSTVSSVITGSTDIYTNAISYCNWEPLNF